ncbi:MAG: M23 family metallopeptidase [Chloroflexi bacterium]|nr:MAG: M23 family metallopeptidase [Chloroflexota bacterium]
MNAALAVQAGLTLWSFRKPLLAAIGLVLALPLLLIMLVAGMFAPLPEPGQVLFDPLPGALVTQPFGCSDLDLEPWSFTCPSHHFHSGVDLEAAEGTPVYAASAGVAMVDDNPDGYGLFITVRQDDQLSTVYGHLSLVLVESGDAIAAGQLIAETGSSGRSTGPHLHFEVRVAGAPVDPLPMVGPHLSAGGDAPLHQ